MGPRRALLIRIAGARSSFEPHRGEAQAGGSSFGSQPVQTDGRHFESYPTRDLETLRINRDVSVHSQSGTSGARPVHVGAERYGAHRQTEDRRFGVAPAAELRLVWPLIGAGSYGRGRQRELGARSPPGTAPALFTTMSSDSVSATCDVDSDRSVGCTRTSAPKRSRSSAAARSSAVLCAPRGRPSIPRLRTPRRRRSRCPSTLR
jgi:hypothetical protein